MLQQATDPAVSRSKFEREVGEFRAQTKDYAKRGWFLTEAEFPHAFVVMAAPQLKPPPLVTGVAFDFSDYDERPPSVALADPFTRVPYTWEELPTNLMRQVEADPSLGFQIQLPPGAEPARMLVNQPLMQPSGAGGPPFMCIAGVREYHDHPGHSGDSWDLHRAAGAGRLVRILEVIDTYGVRPLSDYNLALQMRVVGLQQTDVPR
jgi:Predicted metal binding domain